MGMGLYYGVAGRIIHLCPPKRELKGSYFEHSFYLITKEIRKSRHERVIVHRTNFT